MMAASLVRRIAATHPVSTAFLICCRGVSSRQTEFMPWKKTEFYTGKGENKQRPWHRRGPLPRLLNEGPKTKGELHKLIMQKKDPWHPVEALKGQNDFVDILGDGSIHPVRLLTNVPRWLRGFKGPEIQMLNRKWRAHKGMNETHPRAWLDIKKRIDYLYAYMNLRKRPPHFQDY